MKDWVSNVAKLDEHKEGEEKEIGSDGLSKMLLRAGQGWEFPQYGDEVQVHYTGTLLDGTKFDSSWDRGKSFKFRLGKGHMVKGFDQGIATMLKGENAIFTIPPSLAYGDAGAPPSIPPNATLCFDVQLLSWSTVKDLCMDGSLLKKITKEGDGLETPGVPDEVKVKYEAWLEDGTVISRSPEDGIEFYVREGLFCSAIALAVKTMRKGEKAILEVRPPHCYGEKGPDANDSGTAIPMNSILFISIELLSWNVVEEVTDDKRVVKKILKLGEGQDKPNDGSVVKVRYTAKLKDGTVFECKGYGDELFEFVTDEGQVIDGLDRVLGTMKKGEVALVTIAPDYGFGSIEAKCDLSTVPPNSTLFYEIELDSFIKEKESWAMNNAEKIEAAGKIKMEGNELFKIGKYWRASRKYEKAFRYIEYDNPFSEEEKQQAKMLKASCMLNNSACELKLKHYKEAIKLCSKILEQDAQNVKALYRRSQSYMETGDLELAESDIRKALKIDPQNREVRQLYKILKSKHAEYEKKAAEVYGNIVTGLSKLDTKEQDS